MKYAVIITYSFDDDTPVYLFETEEEAKEFLSNLYKDELYIDEKENEWDVVGEISDDGRYAKITTHFFDRDDIVEYRVGDIHEI